MSAIGANATREDRLKWLTRPVTIAYGWTFFGGFMGGMMWLNGIETEYVLIIAIGAHIGATGLLLWGLKRITNVSQGQF